MKSSDISHCTFAYDDTHTNTIVYIVCELINPFHFDTIMGTSPTRNKKLENNYEYTQTKKIAFLLPNGTFDHFCITYLYKLTGNVIGIIPIHSVSSPSNNKDMHHSKYKILSNYER